jgi:hypothetical protein
MNTYQYNIAGEINYVRAEDRFKAFLRVFHGELKRVGRCSIKPQDLKLVKSPTREIMNNMNARDLDNDISRVHL